jgi:protein O-mannosyl-transferase
MKKPNTVKSQNPKARHGAYAVALAALLLSLAAFAVYSNSFHGPFVFDDVDSIRQNRTIRRLGALGDVLAPPRGAYTVAGRPVLNLSFALSYAMGGGAEGPFHAVNLIIHVLAGLLLMGIVRRTLILLDKPASTALLLASGAALIWLVHPLQTEAVTYTVQRAESLAGLFFLLTLYAFIRGAVPAKPRWGYAAAVAACALGMLTKESVAMAPLMVLAYDRIFLAPSFKEIARLRKYLYAALFACWGILPVLIMNTGLRGGSVGPDANVRPLSYALTQLTAVTHYLRLVFWPHPLVLDYGTPLYIFLARVIPAGLVIAGIGVLTLWALRKAPPLGFLGLWFFVTLAPSSSIIPITTQTMAEHRMYLPLAALAVALVACGDLLIRRYAPKLSWKAPFAALLIAAALLGAVTHRRNETYSNALTLWSDTAAHAPLNARAHVSLSNVLWDNGKAAEALEEARRALQLEPKNANALNQAGMAEDVLGHGEAALQAYDQAVQYNPKAPWTYVNRGNMFWRQGKLEEAVRDYTAAIERGLADAESYTNRGTLLAQLGRPKEGIADLEKASRLDPGYWKAAYNLGVAHSTMNPTMLDAALADFSRAAQIRPDFAEGRISRGGILFRLGKWEEALDEFSQAIALQPRMARARLARGNAYAARGMTDKALADFTAAIEMDPTDEDARRAYLALAGKK